MYIIDISLYIYVYHSDFFESIFIVLETRKKERRSMLESMDSSPSPRMPIIFSWVSLTVGEGGSKRRKNTTKRCFQFLTTKRARGERMNGRVRVVRRIHDEAITTFFAGEVMCYWGATRCNLCLHQGSRVHIVPGAPMKCPDNNGPPFVHDALLMSRGIP